MSGKFTKEETIALARTDVDHLRAVFNPDCKHERCSYDIQTCKQCLDYSAKIQKEPRVVISMGTITNENDQQETENSGRKHIKVIM